MGVVWVAHNLTLDVHVAIKLIRGTLGGKVAASRLLYEARSAARIAHPGVVRIYDFGTTDRGDPFIVMELLQGETLRDLLDREQRLDPLRAAALMLPVAEALAVLADNGIIHRDLKPDNVILVPSGDDRVQPKLVDFGVAILPGTERLTADGLVVGTPDYLAPEQATADEIDGRVDVWAFSLILFELVTGGRPFTGESPTVLMTRILVDTPASITAYGVREPELAAIISKGLAKAREDRWETIRAEGAALATWARSRGLGEDVTGATVRDRASDGGGYRKPLPSAPSSQSGGAVAGSSRGGAIAGSSWNGGSVAGSSAAGSSRSGGSAAKTEVSARKRHWGAPSQPGWGPRREVLPSYPEDLSSSRPSSSPPPPRFPAPSAPVLPQGPSPAVPSLVMPQGQGPQGQSLQGHPPMGQGPQAQSPQGHLPMGPAPMVQSPLGPAPMVQSPREQSPFLQAPMVPSLVLPSAVVPPARGSSPMALPQRGGTEPMLPPQRGPAPLLPRGPVPMLLPRQALELKTTDVAVAKRRARLRLGLIIAIVMLLVALVVTAVYRASLGSPAGTDAPSGGTPSGGTPSGGTPTGSTPTGSIPTGAAPGGEPKDPAPAR